MTCPSSPESRRPWSIDAGGFHLTEPYADRSYANYLSNGEYALKIDHLGTGFSVNLAEPRLYVTHHGYGLASKGRYLYCREGAGDAAAVWNPGFAPSGTALDRYEARHGAGFSSIKGAKDGVTCESLHILPRRGRFEIWRLRARNESGRDRSISLFPLVEFLLQSSYAVDLQYYSWYTNTRAEEGGRSIVVYSRKPTDRPMFGFIHSLAQPDGYETSLRVFAGKGGIRRPDAVLAEEASREESAGDPYIGCFRFDLTLKPGETWETALFIGEGEDALDDARDRFSSVREVDEEYEAVTAHWKTKLGGRDLGKIENAELRAWLSTFLPYQIHQQALGMVRSEFRGYRDVAQDAAGIAYYDLEAARRLIIALLDKQHLDGRCLRQWNTSGGLHDERDFRDLPFWLVFALSKYLDLGGAPDILEVRRPYLEGGPAETVLQHIERGLRYVLRFGPHDLLEIGAGDWNDALSGLGVRGESLWLNEMAYFCLERLDVLAERWGIPRPDLDQDAEALKDRLYRGVSAGWTHTHFLRGYHESGIAVGAAERIFLLPQAWFTISGMARRDGAKAERALDSMVERLGHPEGLLKCSPAFTSYDETVGNLSALTPGMAENYAVYNHASAYGIYALLEAGRTDLALTYLHRLLPFRKDVERTLCEPYVLVNYYNGGYYPGRAGRGGITWLTGTANWLAMILFDHLVPKGIAWGDAPDRDAVERSSALAFSGGGV